MKKHITTVIVIAMTLVALAWLTSKDDDQNTEVIQALRQNVEELRTAWSQIINQHSLWITLSNQHLFSGMVSTQLVAVTEQQWRDHQALVALIGIVDNHTASINSMLSNRYNLK